MPIALRHRVVLCLLSVVALGGCGTPLQRSTAVTIEVIDAITGAPVPDVEVIQHVHTGKFERPLGARAITDELGVAHIDAIGGVEHSFWRVGIDGPTYDGVGQLQVPAEFRPVAPQNAERRFVAPAWPAMGLRIELPEGYRGPLVEWSLDVDHPRSSGWMPPSPIDPGHGRVAVATANTEGVVAYPSSIGGVPGFAFVPERGILRGRNVVWSVSANIQNPQPNVSARYDRESVVLWHIGFVDDHSGSFVAPQGSSARPNAPLVWFVGTEQDLRAWAHASDLQPVRPAVRGKFDEIARARVFTRASLFRAIQMPAEVTAAPTWGLRPTDR